jgi:hypothetical protein
MATAQPMMSPQSDDLGSDDTGADPSQAGESQDDGSYVIEIRVGSDKSISVCVESGSEEAAEEQGEDSGGGDDSGGGEDDDSTPVKSIKEALTLALEIFRSGGQMPQGADDDFQQGFAGGKG